LQTELKQFTSRVLEKLFSYSWLCNARQLENETKRLVAWVRGKSITEDHLDTSIRKSRRSHSKLPSERGVGADVADSSILTGCSRAARTPPNRRGTAKFWWQQTKSGPGLGLSRQGLIKKLKRFSISQ
jgi:DNA-binding NtrC family response regulator